MWAVPCCNTVSLTNETSFLLLFDTSAGFPRILHLSSILWGTLSPANLPSTKGVQGAS